MRFSSVCITGASSGLGKALALALAEPGIHLILTGRDMARLEEVKSLAEEKKAIVIALCGDLCQESDRRRLEELLQETCPDLLFLNAGMGWYGRFVDTPIERSEAIVDLNISVVMRLTKTWCEAMLSLQKKGKVVFIASTAAFLPIPGMGTYAASKAFIVSFAEALRFELRATPLRVLTICPGYFRTRFQDRAAGKTPEVVDESGAQKLAQKIVKGLWRTELYIPLPWRWLLPLRYLVPKRLQGYFLEKRLLSMRRNVQS